MVKQNINGMFLPTGPMSEEHKRKKVESFKRTMQGRGTMTGKSHTKETRNKIKSALSNKPKSAEHIASMRKRPQDTTTLTCPHCDKTGDYKNMKRWHMDRCKHNPNRVADIDPKLVTCTKCGHTAKQSPNFYRNHNEHCRT